MNDKLHPVIGIDLGTTYSAVAVYNTYKERAEIIADKTAEGKKTTPSVIGVDQSTQRVIVGYPAKRNLAVRDIRHPSIIEAKREMGELFNAERLEKFHAKPKWKVGDPVHYWFIDGWFLPQELSAFTLMKMKAIAEAELGCEVRDAVITVPAYFTETQRKATEEAALMAGLYPRQLIPEPTAAAICYGVDKGDEESKIYLVYDLGGGTFDVSIIKARSGDIEVIATNGDPRLGGGDFDDAIVKWAREELLQKYGSDPRFAAELMEPGTQAAIKYNAEQAKIALSDHPSTELNLADLWPRQAPILTLTREHFNHLIEEVLKKSITYVNLALEAAACKGVTRDSIDAILLVGGSTKIRLVKDILLRHFEKDDSFVRADLDPDAVVARGAALLARTYGRTEGEFDVKKYRAGLTSLNRNIDESDQGVYRLIAEHSLGIEVHTKQGPICHMLIAQGTNIPITKTEGGFFNGGQADHIPVNVFQGESKWIHENTLIGTVKIEDLKPMPEGFHKFDVEFTIDESGLLSVIIHHLNEGKKFQGKFEQKTGVGGDQQLATRHVRLLRMFQEGGSPRPPAPPPRAAHPDAAAPPRVPAPPSAADSPAPRVPAPATAAGAPPSRVSAPTPTVDSSPIAGSPAVPAASPAGVPHAVSASASAGAATRPIEIQDRTKVPRDLRPVVRSVQRLLMEDPSKAWLLSKYNEFVMAVNGGAGDVNALGDDLCDAYEEHGG
jgi:molecular chaperone DnaK